jgi:polyhydroxybutyrate depolymerase
MLCLALVAAACGESSSAPSADASAVDSDASTSSDPDAAGNETGTPGCGETGAPTGTVNDSVTVRGEARTFILAVPDDYDPDTPYPIVFAWHGRGSNAAQARAYFGVEQAAANAAIFLYADGLPQASVEGDTGWDLSETGVDIELFDVLLERVSASHCLDSSRVFNTGHSFGGYMSNSVACFRGDVVRGIAPIAGGGPFGACDGPVAAWIAHGTVDSVVPFSQGEGSHLHWRDTNSCDDATGATQPAPCVAHSGCGARPVVWCAHDEPAFAGHGWPSFAPAAIWAFFADLD